MNRAIFASFVALAAACSQPPESVPSQSAQEVRPAERVDSQQLGWEVNEENIARAPKAGDMAPDFSLARVGGGTARLSDATAMGPVVLVFGSATCPPFRMRTHQLEDLAKRLEGKAQFFIVYSREAHPNASDAGPINEVANGLIAMDADGDGVTALSEFEGERMIFEAFDLNGDGRLVAHEFLTARRILDFESFGAPLTAAERMQAATRFRAEVPGAIPVLVDTLDNATSLAYGSLPNGAFAIGSDGEIKAVQMWLNARGVEAVLAELLGQPVPEGRAVPPDWKVVGLQLERAESSDRRLLIRFTTLGCAACSSMNETTLADPQIRDLISRFEYASLDLAKDDAWNLFQALELSGTPAFVIVSRDRKILGRGQGYQDVQTFAKFLQG